jgi:parallel beta-helix repeat protein
MPAKLRPHAAPAALVALAVVVTLAVVALVASSGAAVAAKQPKCGDTITKDTTLHHDLIDCPNNAIVIGADGVNLDLNGHLIDGDETSTKNTCDCAVFNDGHDGVTVRDGSVREFDGGVGVLGARHARVLGVSASRNEFDGIAVLETARSVVRGSSGSLNRGAGLGLFGDSHVRILHNSFRHNGDEGIGVHDSTQNLIKGNLLSRNKNLGIALEGSDRNEVRDNRIVRNGNGLFLDTANRNVIARNRIAHAKRPGVAKAIEVCCANHSVFARNSIRDTDGNAIDVGFGGGVGNVVRGNHIRGAGKDGVHVKHKGKHTLLTRNVATEAGDDGFEIEGRRTKLTKNRAVRNHDLGIVVVRSVIDGGGNIARHNGDPRQCTHIVCN